MPGVADSGAGTSSTKSFNGQIDEVADSMATESSTRSRPPRGKGIDGAPGSGGAAVWDHWPRAARPRIDG